MAAVAILVHRQRPEAAAVARELAGWLEANGHEVRLPEDDADVAGLARFSVDERQLTEGMLDLAVAVGGDGTILRTVHLVTEAGVPVLGVNVGQLGYLSEVEPTDARAAVEKVLAGQHGIEERMMVSVRVEAGGDVGPTVGFALNEAVLEKTPMGHTARIGVSLDGDFWTSYAADGLIVASPTGSTAYSFSARGPIIDPDLRALVLTPVSPHMLFDRSMVLSPSIEVRLEVLGHRPATLSVDGRNFGDLHEGDAVICTAAPQSAQLVTFGPRDFHRILKKKFGLSDR